MTQPEAAELAAVDAVLAGREPGPEHAELAALARALRDERPEPTASWGAQLDRRVAARFPPRAKRRAKRLGWLRPTMAWAAPFAVAGVLVPLVVLAVVLGGGRGDDERGSGGSVAAEEPGGATSSAAPPESTSGGAGSAAGEADSAYGGASGDAPAPSSLVPEAATLPPSQGGGSPGSDGRDRRAVERSASLVLAASPAEVDAVASRAGEVAADLGGFVARSSVTSTDGGDLRLRVPSARLDEAIARLGRLADVRELSRRSEDITAAVVSTRAQLADARAERRGLLRQLEEADSVEEGEEIRARLRFVQREIDAERGQVRRVANRARYADLAVTITAMRGGDEGDDGGAWTPADAADDALRVLAFLAGAALIVLAVLSPLLLVATLWWAARRAARSRRRARALDAV